MNYVPVNYQLNQSPERLSVSSLTAHEKWSKMSPDGSSFAGLDHIDKHIFGGHCDSSCAYMVIMIFLTFLEKK